VTNFYADVFAFADFRLFLSRYFEERRKKDKGFTQSYICRKLGLPNSRSFFGDIVRGQKPLTGPKTEALIEVLELRGDEAKYFRALVLYNQSAVPSEKELYLEQLIALNRSPAAVLDRKVFEYYRDWHHATIRALLDVLDIKDDPTPLARAIFPPVTLGKVKDSFALLKKLGLIRKNSDGCWKPSQKIIHSGPYMQDEIVKKYQVECLEVAKRATLDRRERSQNMSTETLSISEKGYRLIEEKLQKFKSEVRSIVHKDDAKADRVYQLNIQLFPQSK
jgi:uncharacterized protein (TIGR02147 family)